MLVPGVTALVELDILQPFDVACRVCSFMVFFFVLCFVRFSRVSYIAFESREVGVLLEGQFCFICASSVHACMYVWRASKPSAQRREAGMGNVCVLVFRRPLQPAAT